MMTRCRNPNDAGYHNYGGRGITVCERWSKFENFLADMGERPEGQTLDRYPNNNGNYEPANCRWASHAEQQLNTRKVQVITFGGKTMSMRGWARNLGVSWGTLRHRLDAGWSVERTLTTPPTASNGKKRGHKEAPDE
jgi:hypothetical protein